MSVDFCTKEEKAAIKEELVGARWDSPYGKEMLRYVRHGIGIHHAGLLPKSRLMVEKLAQRGLLKVVCGTDTLGVGVDVHPHGALHQVVQVRWREDGAPQRPRLSSKYRAAPVARASTSAASVVRTAPEHVIENLRLEAKAQGDAKKLRKLVRKKEAAGSGLCALGQGHL